MPFVGKLRLFSAMTLLLLISCMPQLSSAPSCPVPTPLTPVGIPIDVCGPMFDFTEFGAMAWQTFKTLVWPAASRGVADGNLKITDKDKRSLVFETYKADWETFPASGIPLGWDEYPKKAPVCEGASSTPPLANDALVLASLNKFGNLDQADVSPPDQGVTPPKEKQYETIFYLTIAQNGSPVRYLTGFSKEAYESILDYELYKPNGLNPSMAMPVAGKTRMKEGTITIKSAWIEIAGFDAGRFHTRVALVQDPPSKTCREALVGLVGLHIAHKTESSPQWIWASFEHVDNAPYRGKPVTLARYTFNMPEKGKGGRMPDHPPAEARIPTDTQKKFIMPRPYNVERLKEIHPALQKVNDEWRKMLSDKKSVWANYELVAVQWPRHRHDERRIGAGRDVMGQDGVVQHGAFPTPPCTSVTPEASPNVSNSVIETFLQSHTVCHWDLTCMSCHNQTRNFDFVWSIPLARAKTAMDPPSVARRAALSTLYEIVGKSLQPAGGDDKR